MHQTCQAHSGAERESPKLSCPATADIQIRRKVRVFFCFPPPGRDEVVVEGWPRAIDSVALPCLPEAVTRSAVQGCVPHGFPWHGPGR